MIAFSNRCRNRKRLHAICSPVSKTKTPACSCWRSGMSPTQPEDLARRRAAQNAKDTACLNMKGTNAVRWLVLACAIVAVTAHAADRPAVSGLYIVSAFFSDNGAALYYRLIEVSPDGRDSIVRYSRVASVNIYCPRMIVQSAEVRCEIPLRPSWFGATTRVRSNRRNSEPC